MGVEPALKQFRPFKAGAFALDKRLQSLTITRDTHKITLSALVVCPKKGHMLHLPLKLEMQRRHSTLAGI
jgi:hypothetical protein